MARRGDEGQMVGGLVEMSPCFSHWQSITQSDRSFLGCWPSAPREKQILILENCPLAHPDMAVRSTTGMNMENSCVGLSRRTGACFLVMYWKLQSEMKISTASASSSVGHLHLFKAEMAEEIHRLFLVKVWISLQASGASAFNDNLILCVFVRICESYNWEMFLITVTWTTHSDGYLDTQAQTCKEYSCPSCFVLLYTLSYCGTGSDGKL